VLVDCPAVPIDEFQNKTGWRITPEGCCLGERCVPIPKGAIRHNGTIELGMLAASLGLPLVHDERHEVWAFGPLPGGKVLESARCPEVLLEDMEGNEFALSSALGKKVVLVAWASWCGCRDDLPGWQALHEELQPLGVAVVTAAMDMDIESTRPWIESARPTHPSLLDPSHKLGEKLGFVNVPTSAWIDEEGWLVRCGDVAAIAPNRLAGRPISPALPPRVRQMLRESQKISVDHEAYLAALRDWAEKGPASQFALAPRELVRRSRERTAESCLAAANFEMAEYLCRQGCPDDAVPYLREAHRLQPDNWTYKRQAWSLADPAQGPTDRFEGDWLADVLKIGGGEHYYPRFEP
jgi:peroxiredoxin